MKKLLQFLLVGICFTYAAVSAASAESVKIQMKSDHPKQVMLKFYSMHRDHYWPSADRSYVIKDYDLHTYHLGCNRGEKICWGAWVKNRPNGIYWGIGTSRNNGCKNCCITCDGSTYSGSTLKP